MYGHCCSHSIDMNIIHVPAQTAPLWFSALEAVATHWTMLVRCNEQAAVYACVGCLALNIPCVVVHHLVSEIILCEEWIWSSTEQNMYLEIVHTMMSCGICMPDSCLEPFFPPCSSSSSVEASFVYQRTYLLRCGEKLSESNPQSWLYSLSRMGCIWACCVSCDIECMWYNHIISICIIIMYINCL